MWPSSRRDHLPHKPPKIFFASLLNIFLICLSFDRREPSLWPLLWSVCECVFEITRSPQGGAFLPFSLSWDRGERSQKTETVKQFAVTILFLSQEQHKTYCWCTKALSILKMYIFNQLQPLWKDWVVPLLWDLFSAFYVQKSYKIKTVRLWEVRAVDSVHRGVACNIQKNIEYTVSATEGIKKSYWCWYAIGGPVGPIEFIFS